MPSFSGRKVFCAQCDYTGYFYSELAYKRWKGLHGQNCNYPVVESPFDRYISEV